MRIFPTPNEILLAEARTRDKTIATEPATMWVILDRARSRRAEKNKPGRHIMKTFSVLVVAILALLVSIASPSFGISTMGRHVVGVIQEVNAQAREAELLQAGKAKPLRFTWDDQTRFVANQHFVDATILNPGARVEVVFHPHFFGSPYVTRVTLLSTSIGHDGKMK